MKRRIRPKQIPLLVALAQRGLTARRFAAMAALNPATISSVLNQRQDPTPETRAKIAKALGVNVDDIFPAQVES